MNRIKFITTAILVSSIFTFNSCSDDDDSCNISVWYQDLDGDGYGNEAVAQSACSQPENYVDNADDIDDTDADLNIVTIWQGETMTFTKENNADWTLEANQDRITDNVWITRANTQGIFNIAVEEDYEDFVSPVDTEWAFGTTEELGSLTFNTWELLSDSNPPSTVDQNMVLHLITDDIYIDIKFTSWTGGGQGGGFSHERSTMN